MSRIDDLVIGNICISDERGPLGNLVIDANFECGNLGRVDQLNPCEYDLFIRPDTCNSKYRVWFYFAVENARENQRVVFNIVNFSKNRNLFDSANASPVYKVGSDGSWSRIAAKHIFYYRSQAHGDRFILSFVHIFRSTVRTEFAYCIPYSYTKLQEFLLSIESRNLPFFKRDPLTETVQRRRVDLLTITSTNELTAEKQKIVFISARVHPGETPSSYVLQGFLEFLVSDDIRAVKLRSIYTFKIVPMLNPDGVFLGNYRCSLMGFDLNRQWQDPSIWAHPSILATKNLLMQYNENPRDDLCLCIDLHAHSQQTNSFLIGNLVSKEPKRCQQQLYIPYLLAELTDDYSLQYTQFNIDAEKAGTSRRTMGAILDEECLCYTLEASFFSYRPKDNQTAKSIPYFDYTYEFLGENLAIAILQYDEVMNNQRKIEIKRPFETFLPKRCIKSFKQFGRSIRSLSRSTLAPTK